jgi:putative transposase
MPDYRRNYTSGGTYFFTVVTHQRLPILTSGLGRECFRKALLREQVVRPFDLFAIVLLPDHLHCIWSLPPGDADYSLRWSRIKGSFSRAFLLDGGQEGTQTASRERHRERAIWQRRFWEHTCRNVNDLKRCLDYLHWNPVKHGLVNRVKDYAWSSFDKFVQLGEYDLEWGSENPCPGYNEPEWE